MSRRSIRSNKTRRLTLEALESRLAPSVYYVSPTGSDNNPGSLTSPLQTIQHAADLVNPGDTVLVNDGVYTKPTAPGPYSNYTSGYTAVVTVWRGGTAGNMITFKSINQYGAKIDGQNNTTFSGFMFANQVGFIRVEGFDLYGESDSNLSVAQGDAFDIYNGGHDLQIVGNNIHNIGNFYTDTTDGLNGIFIGNNYLNTIPSGTNILVQGNLIHDIGRLGPGPANTPYYENHDHGIYIHEGNTVTIINNVFYNNHHGWDIQLYPSPISNLNILNNTFAFYNPWRNGQIIISGALTNANIENNIFYEPSPGAAGGFSVSSALEIEDNKTITNMLVSNNLTYGGTCTFQTYSGITFVNNIDNTDPLFVNSSPTSFDFRLQTDHAPANRAGIIDHCGFVLQPHCHRPGRQ